MAIFTGDLKYLEGTITKEYLCTIAEYVDLGFSFTDRGDDIQFRLAEWKSWISTHVQAPPLPSLQRNDDDDDYIPCPISKRIDDPVVLICLCEVPKDIGLPQGVLGNIRGSMVLSRPKRGMRAVEFKDIDHLLRGTTTTVSLGIRNPCEALEVHPKSRELRRRWEEDNYNGIIIKEIAWELLNPHGIDPRDNMVLTELATINSIFPKRGENIDDWLLRAMRVICQVARDKDEYDPSMRYFQRLEARIKTIASVKEK
jgi:hypothetical protein